MACSQSRSAAWYGSAVLPSIAVAGMPTKSIAPTANPCVLARISHEELEALFRGYGYDPIFVEGSEPAVMHQAMAAALGDPDGPALLSRDLPARHEFGFDPPAGA